MRRHPENDIQSAIVDYCRVVAPDFITYANANAARRTKSGFASNGVPGLFPGIPDLTMVGAHGRALYIEVKAKGGVLGKAQEAVRERMIKLGIPWCCAFGIDDVRAFLSHYNIETREARS